MWIKYPGGSGGQVGEQVTTTYDSMGLPRSLAGSSSYVVESTYTALGQVDLRSLSGGDTPAVSVDYAYRSGDYRLEWLETRRVSTNDILQWLQYGYDPAGNVITITDHAVPSGPQEQLFTYESRAIPQHQCEGSHAA